jgi:hypothetical protein
VIASFYKFSLDIKVTVILRLLAMGTEQAYAHFVRSSNLQLGNLAC